MSGKIVGGRARRRRHEHAVAGESGKRNAAVDGDLDLAVWRVSRSSETSLMAAWTNFSPATVVACIRAAQRGLPSPPHPLGQAVDPPIVHQESDRTPVHAEDRLGDPRRASREALKHEAVAPERDERLGFIGLGTNS